MADPSPVGNNLGNPVERSVFVAARALGTTYDYVQNYSQLYTNMARDFHVIVTSRENALYV